MRLSVLSVCTAIVAAASFIPARAGAQSAPPKLNLGRADWRSEEAFSGLYAMRELENGNVIVSDALDREVWLLSNTGSVIRQIGRKGAGPGEYDWPQGLIALSRDTTLLVDPHARRYLIIDGRGQITATRQFPDQMGEGAANIKGADKQGRLLFSLSMPKEPGAPSVVPINRWQRGGTQLEDVTMITVEAPEAVPTKALEAAGLSDGAVRQRLRFGPVTDWAVAPSGRIAIIHAKPYRVDWVELNGTTTRGTAVPYQPVPVTEQDKKRLEPKGPPYKRLYAKEKSPFEGELAAPVTDDLDNLWIRRSEPAGAPTSRWDVFSPQGKHLGIIPIASNKRLTVLTRRYAYVVHTDGDGLQWLERYAR